MRPVSPGQATGRRGVHDPLPARLLALATAALLVSFLVVQRTGSVLGSVEVGGTPGLAAVPVTGPPPVPAGTENRGNDLASSWLSLSDDDGGQALFTVDDLAPGSTAEGCISLTYEGGPHPAEIRLGGEVSGELAPALDLDVEVGTGAAFGECDAFHAEAELYRGPLDRFGADHGPDGGGLVAYRADEPGTRTFRFEVSVAEDVEPGASAEVDFLWQAVPL